MALNKRKTILLRRKLNSTNDYGGPFKRCRGNSGWKKLLTQLRELVGIPEIRLSYCCHVARLRFKFAVMNRIELGQENQSGSEPGAAGQRVHNHRGC